MSKSENQLATLYIAYSDEMIREKVMKAKTDAGPTSSNTEMPPEIEYLFVLLDLVSEKAVTDSFRTAYESATIRYGDLKKQLAEDMVKFIAPIRQKANEI